MYFCLAGIVRELCFCGFYVFSTLFYLFFSSGIEEPERSDFEVATDEALLIKQEVEQEQTSSCSKKRQQDAADIAVLAAAEAGRVPAADHAPAADRAPAAPDLDVQPSSSTPGLSIWKD